MGFNCPSCGGVTNPVEGSACATCGVILRQAPNHGFEVVIAQPQVPVGRSFRIRTDELKDGLEGYRDGAPTRIRFDALVHTDSLSARVFGGVAILLLLFAPVFFCGSYLLVAVVSGLIGMLLLTVALRMVGRRRLTIAHGTFSIRSSLLFSRAIARIPLHTITRFGLRANGPKAYLFARHGDRKTVFFQARHDHVEYLVWRLNRFLIS